MRGQPPQPSAGPPVSPDTLFEEAYRSSGTAVLGYALRRCDSRDDALDVVAETFATAWRRRAELPADPDEIRPWLFGIARYCLANVARSASRASRLGQRLAEQFTGTELPDPSRLHEHGVERRQVRLALDQLSDDDRELVTLIAWEGLTPAGAAAVLGLTPGAARVRLHRARTRLRAALDTPAQRQQFDQETDHDH